MNIRKKLFGAKDPYDIAGTDDLFTQAMVESVRFHEAHCKDYARILRYDGFKLEEVRSADALHKVPPIPTLYLKSHELLSMPGERLYLRSTTSGTKGKPVTVALDRGSLYYGALMLRRVLGYHHLFSCRPTNYIVLGYQPSRHNHMGAVKTAFGTTLLAPALHREYALKDTGTDYALNIEGVQNALLRYAHRRAPVRLLGFPAYMYFLLKTLHEAGIQLKLPDRSMVLLGGGWKQFFAEQVDKSHLYAMIELTLGIPEARIREFFGVVEHQVPYLDCANHHFHVPVYGRVIIRDPDTLLPVPNGVPGILNLLSPLIRSMPLLSVMTDDIAVLRDGAACGCGVKAPYFEILGRVGMQGIKTCAAGANEALKGVRP